MPYLETSLQQSFWRDDWLRKLKIHEINENNVPRDNKMTTPTTPTKSSHQIPLSCPFDLSLLTLWQQWILALPLFGHVIYIMQSIRKSNLFILSLPTSNYKGLVFCPSVSLSIHSLWLSLATSSWARRLSVARVNDDHTSLVTTLFVAINTLCDVYLAPKVKIYARFKKTASLLSDIGY